MGSRHSGDRHPLRELRVCSRNRRCTVASLVRGNRFRLRETTCICIFSPPPTLSFPHSLPLLPSISPSLPLLPSLSPPPPPPLPLSLFPHILSISRSEDIAAATGSREVPILFRRRRNRPTSLPTHVRGGAGWDWNQDTRCPQETHVGHIRSALLFMSKCVFVISSSHGSLHYIILGERVSRV